MGESRGEMDPSRAEGERLLQTVSKGVEGVALRRQSPLGFLNTTQYTSAVLQTAAGGVLGGQWHSPAAAAAEGRNFETQSTAKRSPCASRSRRPTADGAPRDCTAP